MSKKQLCIGILVSIALAGCQSVYEPSATVQSGLDVLVETDFEALAGKTVGLVTNHTAISRQGQHIADLLHQSDRAQLAAIFAPEHGFRGSLERGTSEGGIVDPKTGVPIYSVYGENRKPDSAVLDTLDGLVFDIQDVGTRFYTYISTLYHAIQAVADAGKSIWVLDRPNPISGTLVEGPVLKSEFKSFVGIHEIPLRHGMTVGELARLFNQPDWLGGSRTADLIVVKMKNWKRTLFFDETGLPWVQPSPNMVSLQTALVYPGTGLLEGTNVSEGRGTRDPFVNLGAPWIDAQELLTRLSKRPISGLALDTTSFVPVSIPDMATYPKYEGKRCHGLSLHVVHPIRFESVAFGTRLLVALHELYPDSLQFKPKWLNKLLGTETVLQQIRDGYSYKEIIASWQEELETFRSMRNSVLLY